MRSNQIGGGNPELIWATYVIKVPFLKRLEADSSLKNLDLYEPDKSIDLEKVKKLFIESDPTGNKKYLTWIFDGYIDGGNHLLEDVNTWMNTTLTKFEKLKQKKTLVGVDMLKYCGLFGCRRKETDQLGLLSLVEQYEEVVSRSTVEKQIKKDAPTVYEDDNIIVIQPKTKEASILYGKGTKWCTAADQSNNMFDRYNQQGPLYIIIPKKPFFREREKYQIHYESGSFMDELDRQVDVKEYARYRDSLIKFTRSLNLGVREDISRTLFDSIESVIADLLISSGYDHNIRDQYGSTLLHKACNKKSEEVVKKLLKIGIDVNVSDKKGQTPLHYACKKRSEGLVEILIDAGADLNVCDENWRTPLHEVCVKGSVKLAEKLLKAGADVNVSDKNGRTPLHEVCARNAENSEKLVKMILNAGTDVNARDDVDNTPLHEAVARDSRKIVEILINAGADVNRRNKQGSTPLHGACALNSEKMIDRLLKAGADVNARDNQGISPLHSASNLEIMKKLIKAGADVSMSDNDGRTIIHFQEYPDFLGMLIEAGADVNIPDNKGNTPLHYGARENFIELVDGLIEFGADLNAQNKTGETPLHMAASANSRKSMESLIKAGANTKIRNNAGELPKIK